jgi:hypothetical protein
MTTSDLSDLEGTRIPQEIRWGAEIGVLGRSVYDVTTGERSVEPIELGSPKARFAFDLLRRQRGYGRARKGEFSIDLTWVGSPPPRYPGPEWKAAVGVDVWNPPLGELRCETCGAIFVETLCAFWDQCLRYKDIAEGKVPVGHFTGRVERSFAKVNDLFWAPVIKLDGFFPRAQTPFAGRELMVPLPAALDDSRGFGALETPQRIPETPPPETLRPHQEEPSRNVGASDEPTSEPPRQAPKRRPLDDFDDSLPEDLRG